MQVTKTFPPNSAIFIEEKVSRKSIVGKKCIFVGEKKCIIRRTVIDC